jgi:hypothetical protein
MKSETHTTLDGSRVLLRDLSLAEREFFRRCYDAYAAGMPWEHFTNLAEGAENPVIAASGGWITADVRRHPLYRAVRDLEDRLGLAQGKLAPAGSTPTAQDSAIPAAVAPG